MEHFKKLEKKLSLIFVYQPAEHAAIMNGMIYEITTTIDIVPYNLYKIHKH